MTVDYQALINKAMLMVLKEALIQLATYRNDFVEESCFFISFVTRHPGVVLSTNLKSRHPDEMTIVMQHQFENLRAGEDSFKVVLYFDGRPESITVPYAAITSYADQAADFTLSFNIPSYQDFGDQESLKVADEKSSSESNVIFLDQFRK
jgi:hypothetical protein